MWFFWGALKHSIKDVKSHRRKIKSSLYNKKEIKLHKNKVQSQSVHTIFQNKILYLAQTSILSTVYFSDLSEHYWFLFHTVPTVLPSQDAMNWHYCKHSGVQPMLLLRHRFSPSSEDARTTGSPSLPLLLALKKEVASLIIPSICHQNAHCCCNSGLQEFPVGVLD